MVWLNMLKDLSEAIAPPGFEDRVRAYITARLEEWGFNYEVDRLGNVYVKLGEGRPVTVVSAHMDEVGFIVRYITEQGFIRVAALGGMNASAAVGTEVVLLGEQGDVYGVIGATPPHLLKGADAQKQLTVEDLFVDIGASSREEVLESGIDVGSPLAFSATFRDLGASVSGKAFDDRIGCTVLLEALRVSSLPNTGTVYVVFTVQEEVGLRGALAAAHRLKPDYGIAIEGTIASDVPGVPGQAWVTRLGGGPALRSMDRTLIANPKLLGYLKRLAREIGVKYQLQLSPASGTDAGSFVHVGAASTAISVPCRYIHSPLALARKEDVEYTIKLVAGLIETPPPEKP